MYIYHKAVCWWYKVVQRNKVDRRLQNSTRRLKFVIGLERYTWLLKFNAGKCVVLKIKKKIKYKYSLNGVYLQEVANQRDLGVIISNDLSPRTHIIEIVKKANQRVGMIRRCFSNHTAKKVQTLYTTMVRSVLEYGAPTWSPYYNKDIDNLEKVQKRCLRLSKEEIVLPSLSRRRLE